MSKKHRKNSSRTVRTALLGVTTATAMAATIAVSAPVPTPPALLAQEQHSVSLTAASRPYQQAQNVINTLLPALVDTFGAQPRVTLDTLLAHVPQSMLTDLLNANGNTINVASLLATLGLNDAGSDLNTAVTAAISSALTDFLTSATTGENATALEAELRAAIAAAVAERLNGVSVTVNVPILGNRTITLSSVIGSSGISGIANSVAGTVAGGIMDNLSDILPTADELTAEVTAVLPDLLTTLFNSADLTDSEGNFQLGNLLDLVGLNLKSLADSGALSITTAGPLFTLARLLGGVDLGWTPGTQSAIADSVNGTGYLDLGTTTLKTNLSAALADALADGSLAADLGTVLTPTLNNVVNQIVDNATATLEEDLRASLNSAVGGLNYTVRVFGQNITIPIGSALQSAISPLIGNLADSLNDGISGNVADLVDGVVETGTGSIGDALNEAVTGAIDAIPDQEIASVRIPIVIGSGMGAFSAGAAYRDVLAQLSSQPGGVDYAGDNPLLGSLTILPAILLNNAGRANGGIMARFADLFAMFGIDAVTPDVAITSSGGTPIGDTGLALGGANLVPVKIDATVEYQLMSDFAAWANPVTLLNNVVAGLLPTYMLRGVDVTGAAGQLTAELEELVGSLADQNAADTNIYLTVRANSLPMLEPLYLIGDVMRLAGLAPVANLVNGLANALSPALRSLTNLGYSDAFWNPETGAYERTLDSAATRVQFGTLPNVNWGEVLPNVLRQLGSGFRTAMTTNNNTGPNALSSVGDLLNGNIGDVLSGLTGAADDALADVAITADESGGAAADEGAANRSVSADAAPATTPPAGEPVEQPAEPVAEEPVEVVEPEVKRLPKTPKRVREAARTAAELTAAKGPAADKAPKKSDNDQGDSGGPDATSEPSDSAGGQNAA
ncbi:hypothetical protein C6A86_000725 [Mycobacterium sp. ITM-2016-00316]|uniref:hypothetical protein n=1 Tax=Mycobacterium sp. ITM-2016-00316 TaxID=2099695 RepID=UPI00287FC522|nr:hypothetical protein [Mycobacterium sp. ITM-2016-00316]WNG82274.1 hypothetical protein C6A86_000725 [Mycobacterium sp. ITM-2016-00316]